MPDVVRCVDPWGQEIVLSSDRWTGHVLGGHPGLAGHAAIIEAVLTRPSFVHHDAVRDDREIFYARSPLPPPYGRAYVKVVVEFRSSGVGRPVTGRVIAA